MWGCYIFSLIALVATTLLFFSVAPYRQPPCILHPSRDGSSLPEILGISLWGCVRVHGNVCTFGFSFATIVGHEYNRISLPV